jgi:flagellin-like protein
MKERGVSPIVATVLLIALTVMAASPVVYWLNNYYSPFRPRFVDLAVYAGLVNENIVRFHIHHIGGDSITFDVDKPTTDRIRGFAIHQGTGIDNDMYCWTFENPRRFRQGDWAFSEVQLHGADLDTDIILNVQIFDLRGYMLYNAQVSVRALDQIPGG